MKKSELEAHRDQYQALFAEARQAEANGQYRKAIEVALAACQFIDGMMRYETKYSEKKFGSISAIELILKYAPFYFDLDSLNKLETLLDEYRRIERDTSHDMGEKLAAARHQTWENYRLWNHIEKEGAVRQSELGGVFGGAQEEWRATVSQWAEMGVLNRVEDSAPGSRRGTVNLQRRLPRWRWRFSFQAPLGR